MLPPKIMEGVFFVDAMWYTVVEAALSKMASSRTLENFFGHLDISDRVLVFFPVVLRFLILKYINLFYAFGTSYKCTP